MPKPKGGEKEQDFISRCIPELIKEGKTQEQAQGACYGMWRQAKKMEIIAGIRKVLKNILSRIKR